MGEMIRGLLVEPMEKPRLVEIEHTLENLQKLVGGCIQAIYPWETRAVLICDDEGKLKGYPPNRVLVDENGKPYDIVTGTFFICGLGVDDFDSISDEDAERFMELFRYPEMFMRTSDGDVMWIRIGSGQPPEMIV